MRQMISIIVAMILFATACSKDETPTSSSAQLEDITVTIGDRTFSAALDQNSTAEAFCKLLPLTLEMNELNGNEKHHYLSTSLPTNRTTPRTIHAGDLMLYGDNCVVLFYETFTTSYSYSPIGHITDTEALKDALGGGAAHVVFASE